MNHSLHLVKSLIRVSIVVKQERYDTEALSYVLFNVFGALLSLGIFNSIYTVYFYFLCC